jgi:four helix bundle protein
MRHAVTHDMQDFKHICAWQRSHALAITLHKGVSHFARAGHAHLRSQLTRAADGISSNTVEGCGAATNKEFARFLDISIKSANETEHHLLTARDLSLFSPDEWQKLAGETIEIRKMIYVYRKKVVQSNRDST